MAALADRAAARMAAALGAAVAAAVTLPALGSGTLWDNSETAYGEVAREILVTHDWLVMHQHLQPWFVQPPLYFWLAALAAKLLGVSAFALRLPSALATIAMGAVAGWAGARRGGLRAGIFAALILSTALEQAILGRLAIMDALLDLTLMATTLLWYRAAQDDDVGAFVGGWLCAALGTLAKGPVALVMPALVVLPFILWNTRYGKGWPRLSPRAWAAGVGLFCAVALPWFAAVYGREGPAFVGAFLGQYTFGRYLGVVENQTGPIWYYVPVVILGFFPWVAFLPWAIWTAARDGIRATGEDAPFLRYLLVWTVVTFVFYSLARTKLPNYIASALPAMALLVAAWWDRALQAGRLRAARISAAAVPVTILLMAVAIALFARTMHFTQQTTWLMPYLILLGSIVFAGSLLTFVLLWIPAGRALAPLALACASVGAVLATMYVALPKAEGLKPIPELAAKIDALREPGDRIAIQGVSGGNALAFYTLPEAKALDGDGSQTREFVCDARRAFVIVSGRRLAEQPSFGRNLQVVGRADGDALLLYDGPACRAAS
ncbi:MAG: glycosyltransferase family 39 protein [bacterium]|nr:glycosyltransferase family 39 protein [bacterium]